ncbi:MAG: thymidylate synthase, partial [Thermoproteota archaeon]
YPCLASMKVDPEIGDAILHKSQYIIREAVEEALCMAENV